MKEFIAGLASVARSALVGLVVGSAVALMIFAIRELIR